MRRVFSDPVLNDLFLRQGYVVVDLLDSSECADMRAKYEAIHGSMKPETFFTTTHSLDRSYRRVCNDAIVDSLLPHVQDLLDDYLPMYGNFMVKPSGSHSVCYLHQDWSFVDESSFRTVNVWVALQDTDLKNGCIHVIPGSQNLPFPVRGRNISRVFDDAVDQMVDRLLIPVPLKEGQGVIFDSAILHYSPNNNSDRMRVAASLMLYPSDAHLVHYVYDKENPDQITKYNVGKEFFIEFAAAENYSSANGELKTIIQDKQSFESIQSMLSEYA